MIKILKPGKIQVVECPKCACEFSFEDEDIHWGDQKDPYKEVECPCCRYRIDLYLHTERKFV